MRIAVIHTQPLDTREAGVAFVAGAAAGLAQAGAQVSLLVPAGMDSSALALSRLGVDDALAFRVEPMPRTQWSLGPFHPSWSARFRRAVVKTLREKKFDVAVVREIKMAQELLRANLPAKIVFELHNVYTLGQDDPEALRLFPEKKLAQHKERVAAEAEALMTVDGVIALTDGLRKQLVPMFDLDGRIVAAGSALHPLAEKTRDENPTDVAYIGSLDPHKGVGLVVEALRELPDKTRLLLFGHGRHHQPLLDLADQFGVRERLQLAGWHNPAELPAALRSCCAAAVPLEDCFYNRYVTSPMKLFDYARAGVTPVVPKLPVFDELFPDGKGAVVVAESTAGHFAAALRRLVDDSSFRAQKEKELAAFAAAHTWQKRGETLLAFFANLEKRKNR